MLSHLQVKNLAVVESVEVAFGDGLNIITGETGAGKSVLMGALTLVLGGRGDRSVVREGAKEASVEAEFALRPETGKQVDALLEEAGLPACEEGRLVVRRTLSASGGGRCLVNDTSVAAATLRRLGALLVDIHGPYDNQSLLSETFQRRLLDAYGGCAPQRAAYEEAWGRLQGLRDRLQTLQGDTADVEAEIERLRYAVDEITRANLTPEDGDELTERHARAANAEEILSLGQAAAGLLSDSNESVFNQLAAVQQQFTELARILPEAADWRAEAQSVAVQVQELARALEEKLSAMDADPESLQKLDERVTLVQRLKRKYGPTLEEVFETLKRHEARLGDLESRTEQIEKLQREIGESEDEVRKRGAALTKKRSAASARLGRAVTLELHDLGFLKAGFDIALTAAPPGPSGMDAVDFGFAPNPGEPRRPLKAIASSGEIARVALAAKAVLAEHDVIPLLVFDEIDANIGGEVGRAVGEKLRRVAKNHQVVCITHLPQSAVFGQHHFVVQKEVVKNRTCTRIRELDEAGRVDEIARMLGGKGLTSVIEEHARELLNAAKAGRK